MRTLSITTFVTLDGVMQAPGGPGEDPSGGFAYEGWLPAYADGDMGVQINAWFSTAEELVLGRDTYEKMHAFWSTMPQDNPVSVALNTYPKHIAGSADSVGWQGAALIEGDVVEAVRALKEAGDGELQVHGSATLVQTLLAADLVDELRIITFPVVFGQGKRLFGEGTLPHALRLQSTSTTSSGAIIAAYTVDGDVKLGTVTED